MINLNQFLGIGFLINNSIYLNSTYQVTFTTTEFPVNDPEEEKFDPCIRLLAVYKSVFLIFFLCLYIEKRIRPNFIIISKQVIWIIFSIS